jgi:hypothetical protein
MMARLRAELGHWHPRDAGQGIVEYGLILSGSALLAAILLLFFGGTVSAFLQVVGDAIDAAS